MVRLAQCMATSRIKRSQKSKYSLQGLQFKFTQYNSKTTRAQHIQSNLSQTKQISQSRHFYSSLAKLLCSWIKPKKATKIQVISRIINLYQHIKLILDQILLIGTKICLFQNWQDSLGLIRKHKAPKNLNNFPIWNQPSNVFKCFVSTKRDALNYSTIQIKRQSLIFTTVYQPEENLKSLKKIYAVDVFPCSIDANIDLFKLPQSSFNLCSAASAVIESNKIREMENQVKQMMQTSQPYNGPQSFNVNPGYLLSEHYFFIPPFFTDHPEIHKLGDRVICINSLASDHPPFGQLGTIVGLVDAGEIFIEVLWDQAFIGLSNLGGRCSLLQGSVCRFIDVFNLSLDWSSYLKDRSQESRKIRGWNYQTKLFVPSFRQKAIESKIANKKVIEVTGSLNPFQCLEEQQTDKDEEEKKQQAPKKVLQKKKNEQVE